MSQLRCPLHRTVDSNALLDLLQINFLPGQIVATPGALTAFNASGDLPFDYLMPDLTGDWGDLDAEE